jgi:endonuclease/exonuclease/phosphatase family metal-dependent hydrolase
MTLTVMTYNIRHGGGDRLAAIGRVIAANRPDVLAVEELQHFTVARLHGFASAIGMRPHLVRSWFGQPVAVFVREPGAIISTGRVHRPFHHAAARVTLRTDRGPLTVTGTHLWPYSTGKRRWEARWLAARTRPDRMMLVMGDLNALDPWTDHTAAVDQLSGRYRSRHLRRGRPDTRVLQTLTAAGYVDLFRQVGTGPACSVPTGFGGPEFAPMRLDYILGTPPVAALARGCRIVTGGEAEHASDHFPVVAELELEVVADRASENRPPARR